MDRAKSPVMSRIFAFLTLTLAGALPASAQSCAEQSITWMEDGARHTTVIEGRVRNGCPMVRQTIERADASPLQATGRDCDCDLIIDGEEARFTAPIPVVAKRMLEVCNANKASVQPVSRAELFDGAS